MFNGENSSSVVVFAEIGTNDELDQYYKRTYGN